MMNSTEIRKTVSIIIPFHNEDEFQLNIALSSINNQIEIDFSEIEVILIGDGGTKLTDGTLFPLLSNLDIKYYYFENSGGPGVARQRGMDRSNGQYYMFMDGDDELHYTGALSEFFNSIKEGPHDVIMAKYLEQGFSEGHYFYITEPNPKYKWSAAYAKWFNRDHINRLNLKWLEDVRLFEDVYFCSLACELANDLVELDSFVYSWLFNPSSLVRSADISFNNQLHEWSLQNKYYLRKIKKFAPEKMPFDYANSIVMLYFWTKKYTPADQTQLDIEQGAMLQENSSLWDKSQATMRQLLVQFKEPGSEYENFDTSDFEQYMTHQESLFK